MSATSELPAQSAYGRIILVGFMGAGKTREGRSLAGRLGWSFLDFDQEIERRLGSSIPEVFDQQGEVFFRELEGRVGTELLGLDRVVLATGGGWPVAAGRLDNLPRGTLSVWLKVSAEAAVGRCRKEGIKRPLLAVSDPVSRARELIETRAPWYGKARLTVDSEGAMPDDLARRIEEFIKEEGRREASPSSPDA